jgi:Skp family chaperone for outer membrane proteins
MRERTGPGLVILGVCLLTATVFAQQTPPQPEGEPKKRGFKIAVVDIGVLFRDYKRKEKLEEAVNKERDNIRQQLEKDTDDLKRLRNNFDKTQLVPGSDAYMALRDEIRLASNAFEMKSERLQGILKKRVEELTLQILTELQLSISEYGKKHSYDLIFKSDDDESAQAQQGELGAQFQERIFRAQISDVLFHSDAVDITEAVKRELNSDGNLAAMEKREREEKAKRLAPPPPPPGTTTGTPPPATSENKPK